MKKMFLGFMAVFVFTGCNAEKIKEYVFVDDNTTIEDVLINAKGGCTAGTVSGDASYLEITFVFNNGGKIDRNNFTITHKYGDYFSGIYPVILLNQVGSDNTYGTAVLYIPENDTDHNVTHIVDIAYLADGYNIDLPGACEFVQLPITPVEDKIEIINEFTVEIDDTEVININDDENITMNVVVPGQPSVDSNETNSTGGE